MTIAGEAIEESKGAVMSGEEVRERDVRTPRSAKGVVITQLVAYAALLIVAALVSIWPSDPVLIVWTILVAVTGLGALLRWWPFDDTFRTSVVERMVSGLAGICAFVAAGMVVPHLVRDPGAATSRASITSWAVVFGILVTVLVIVGFITQMLRTVRSHLIRSLSHAVFGGIACVSAAGWCFLPVFIAIALTSGGGKHVAGVVIVMAVVLLILLSLGAAAASWWREGAEDGSHDYIGVALLPVMIGGIAMYMATLAMYFLIF